MAYRRTIRAVLLLAAVYGCGALAVFSWERAVWGSFCFSLLGGVWFGWELLRPNANSPSSFPSPPNRENLEGERLFLRSLLDQVPVPVLLHDAAGRLKAINRAARELFRTDEVVVSAPRALTSAEVNRYRHDDRSYRIDRATIGRGGNEQGLIILVETGFEERVAEARATRDLLEVLSHEVMNALGPITSLADTAQDAVDEATVDRDRLKEIIGTLALRADALHRFTDAYRSMARIPDPVMESSALGPIFDDLEHLFESRWRGRVTLRIDPPGPAEILIDRDQITQALWALLQNGAEAAIEGKDEPWVHLVAHGSAATTRLVVGDSGPGIPAADASRIFRPFFTTKQDGSGIGLSVARSIAWSHGGDLHYLSGPPTSFEILLPRRA